jgi:hypothetical protein
MFVLIVGFEMADLKVNKVMQAHKKREKRKKLLNCHNHN